MKTKTEIAVTEALLDRNRLSLEKHSYAPNIFVSTWLKNEHIAMLLLTSPSLRRRRNPS